VRTPSALCGRRRWRKNVEVLKIALRGMPRLRQNELPAQTGERRATSDLGRSTHDVVLKAMLSVCSPRRWASRCWVHRD
jgi:hypothetical protein